MGELLPLVADDGAGIDAHSPQLEIQQDPGPGATLAIHEQDVRPRQILQGPDLLWIAGWHHQTLIAVHERDQHDWPARQGPTDVAQVVFTGLFVQQV